MTDLSAIAEEIRLLEDEARASQRRPIEIQLAIGEHLLTAREMLRHGDFEAWVERDCRYTSRHARRLMHLALNRTRVSDLDPAISLRGALAAIAKELKEPAPEDLGEWTDDERALRTKLEDGQAVVVNYKAHERLVMWAEANELLVRIDRQSIWGNPYLLDDDGDRATVIANYRDHYLDYKPSLLMRIGDDLEGKALACWCAPEPCHGDVLLESLEGLLIQESVPCHGDVLVQLLKE